jgi:hypothetical protein
MYFSVCMSVFKKFRSSHVVIAIIIIIIIRSYARHLQLYNWNHVSRAYNLGVSLWLQCLAHGMFFTMINILYLCVSTFRSMCAVPNMAVFCTSLIPFFTSIVFRCFLNDFEVIYLLVAYRYPYYYHHNHLSS